MREQRLGGARAEARAEDDQLDRGARGAERLRDRGGRDDLDAALGGLEDQAVLAAVAAEVDHRRPDLAQLAKQIQRLRRPPGLEREAIPVAGALELRSDRSRLAVERARVG